MFDVEQELDQIRNTLDAQQIEYALCGDLAAAVYGDVYAKPGIDLLIKDDAESIASALAVFGFKIDSNPGLSPDGTVGSRSISKTDEFDGEVLTLDFLLVTPALASAWDNRHTMIWNARPLVVVEKESIMILAPFAHPTKNREPIDYSEKAVAVRIRQASQLRKVCLSLGKARPVPKDESE